MMNDVSKLGPLWVSQLRQTVTERRNRAAESLLTLNPDGDYAKHHRMLIDAADAMLAAAPAAPVAAPAPSDLQDKLDAALGLINEISLMWHAEAIAFPAPEPLTTFAFDQLMERVEVFTLPYRMTP